jgi:hypothetical protein
MSDYGSQSKKNCIIIMGFTAGKKLYNNGIMADIIGIADNGGWHKICHAATMLAI